MSCYIPIPLILMTLMSVRSVEAAAEKAIPAKDTIVLQRIPYRDGLGDGHGNR